MNNLSSACSFIQILKSALFSMGLWIPIYYLSIWLINPQRFFSIIDSFCTHLLIVVGVLFIVSIFISGVVKFLLAVPYFSLWQKKCIIIIGFSYWYMPFILLRVAGGKVLEMRERSSLLFFKPWIFLPVPLLLLYFMNSALRRSDSHMLPKKGKSVL